MADFSLASIAAERRVLHEAVHQADLSRAVEVFKGAFSVADKETASKILAILFGDLVVYLDNLDIVPFVQFTHPNTASFYEVLSLQSTPEETWIRLADHLGGLSSTELLDLMKALLGSAINGVEMRNQSESGFDGDAWLNQFIGALTVDDLVGAKRMLTGTGDVEPHEQIMRMTNRVDTVLAALSLSPQGLNGLAGMSDFGRELVETGVKFTGWSRHMAFRRLFLERASELPDLLLLLLSAAKVFLVDSEASG